MSNDVNSLKRDNLKSMMREKNISPTQLAIRLKIKPQYVSALLSGRRNIGPSLLKKLSRIFGVKEIDFFSIHASLSATLPGLIGQGALSNKTVIMQLMEDVKEFESLTEDDKEDILLAWKHARDLIRNKKAKVSK